jgi:hypothetical protein
VEQVLLVQQVLPEAQDRKVYQVQLVYLEVQVQLVL